MNYLYKKLALNFSVYLISGFIIAFFVYPSHDTLYEGWSGAIFASVHGGTILQNWIISLFDSTRILKAVSHDTWYTIIWWISVLYSLFEAVIHPIYLYFSLKWEMRKIQND